jgi:hypothetical protein
LDQEKETGNPMIKISNSIGVRNKKFNIDKIKDRTTEDDRERYQHNS